MAIPKTATLEQLHYNVYVYTLKSLGAQFVEDDAFREKFRNSFPSIFSTSGDDHYTLRLINPTKKRNTYYSSSAKPCPFCTSTRCNNCNLPYTEETVSEYLSKSVDGLLKLEVYFPKHCNQQNLMRLNTTEIHEAYHDASKQHLMQKEAKVSIDDCLRLFGTPE